MSILLLLLGGGAGGSTIVDGSGTGALGTSGSATGATSSTTIAAPVPFVEAAFGYGALTDPSSAVWTDISAYVLSVDIRRGRPTELDAFSPGTCTVELDNSDRRFDPEYTAGPYYGDLIANVPIRVTATVEGSPYPRFYGFVNEWPQSYSPPKWATTQVTATDAFKLFAQFRLPEAVWAGQGLGEPNSHDTWLRLGDTGGVAVDGSGNGHDGYYLQTPSQGAAPAASLQHPSSHYVAEGTGLVRINDPNAQLDLSSATWAISILVIGDAGVTSTGTLVAQSGPNDQWELHYDGGNVVFNSTDTDGGFFSFLGSGATAADITGLHWIYVGSHISGPRVFFDGRELVNESTGVSSFPADVEAVWIGGEPLSWGFFRPNTGLAVMDVSLHQSTNPFINPFAAAENILAAWLDLIQPWLNDNTGTRIGRILDQINWPASQRDIDTGDALLDIAVLARRAPLDYMQQVELTEQGRLFIDKSGKVAFHARDHYLTSTRGTISQATFSDDGSDIKYERDFQLTRDDRYVYREVTGSREGGSTITVTDSTLTGDDPVQTKSLTNLMVRTDSEVRNILESFLLRYKTPRTRPSAWTVVPLDNAAEWHTILGLEIGDRVTIQATPQAVGSQYSADFHIESITESWVGGPTSAARLSFTGSPVDDNSYFRWDSSLLDGTDVLR